MKSKEQELLERIEALERENEELRKKISAGDRMNRDLFDQTIWLGKQIRNYEVLGAKRLKTFDQGEI